MTLRSHLRFYALAFSVFGCATTLRSLTYPPSLDYIPKDRLQSSMWKLAAGTRNLENALRDTTNPGMKKERALASLNEMEETMRSLRPNDASHPLLNRHGSAFLDSVQRAKLGLQENPTDYFYATQVSGACKNCHQDAKN